MNGVSGVDMGRPGSPPSIAPYLGVARGQNLTEVDLVALPLQTMTHQYIY